MEMQVDRVQIFVHIKEYSGKKRISGKEIVVADSLPSSAIDSAQSLINTITGKENLTATEYIKEEVSEVVKLVDIAINKMSKSQSVVTKQEYCLKRISRLLALYKTEVDKIYQTHQVMNTEAALDFEQLQEDECRVIQIACNLAKLYYCVASAKVFGVAEDALDGVSVKDVLREAKKELQTFRKSTYKMTGTDLRAANIM